MGARCGVQPCHGGGEIWGDNGCASECRGGVEIVMRGRKTCAAKVLRGGAGLVKTVLRWTHSTLVWDHWLKREA